MAKILTINGILNTDPTRTFGISSKFKKEFLRRFEELKVEIYDAIVVKDIFGIIPTPQTIKIQSDLSYHQFSFLQSDEKVNKFMEWLQQMEEKHLLSIVTKPGLYGGDQPWTNTYIQSAYQQGLSRANAEMKKAGYNAAQATPIAAALQQPFHADRVAMLYTRTFEDLKTVQAAMNGQIRRELTDGLTNILSLGMAEGKNPTQLVKDLNKLITDRVDKIGISRSKTIARTEVVRAHHQATINEYEQWGAAGVTVKAEWDTAHFGVCPLCQQLEGKEYTLEEIRGMIPRHPNCRCVALPVAKIEGKKKLPPKKQPSVEISPALAEALKNPSATISFNPQTIIPKATELNGVYFNDFDYHLQYSDWGTKELPYEPKMKIPPKKEAAAGMIIVEPDGRVWVYEPKGHYGGYEHTFPKGRVNAGESLQKTAIREVWEETGLGCQVLGYLGDYEKSFTMTRYYIGRRIAGTPLAMGPEAASVKLVPMEEVSKFLNQNVDKVIMDQFKEFYSKAMAMGHGNLDTGIKMINAHKKSTIVQQMVKAELAGKTAPGYVLDFIESLPIDQQQSIKELIEAKVAAGKAKAELFTVGKPMPWENIPVAPIQTTKEAASINRLVITDFKKVGGQLGSNEGGVYEDLKTGDKWYIKKPAGDPLAINEVMTSELYKAAGIDIPDIRLIDMGDGRIGVASKWIDGLTENPELLKSGKLAGVYDGFAVDCWLANWDVIGLGYDNMKVLNETKAFRVDTGGGLIYRARGGEKGNAFGRVVGELDTLRNPQMNPQAATVFGKISKEELEASVRRVVNVPDDDIRRIIDQVGPELPKETRDKIVNTLIERKRYLMEQFPEVMVKTPLPKIEAARITDQEFEYIKDSRINGYVIPTDTKMIEDQQVLVWQELSKDGKTITMAQFKLTPEVTETGLLGFESKIKDSMIGLSKPQFDVKKLVEETKANIQTANDSFITAIRGIGKQANNGGMIREVDLSRIKEAIDQLNNMVTGIIKSNLPESIINNEVSAISTYYRKWAKELINVQAAGVNTKAMWPMAGLELKPYSLSYEFTNFEAPMVKGKSTGIWKEINIDYYVKEIKNGIATRTGDVINIRSQRINKGYQAVVDGATVSYRSTDNLFAVQGTMNIEVEGGGKDAVLKIFNILDKLGINSEKPSDLAREGMYLRQILYQVDADKYTGMKDKFNLIKSDKDRIVALRAEASKALRVKDITKLSDYNPDGVYQAFGQGRVNMFRPGTDTDEWRNFIKNTSLFHKNTGGNSMVGVIDKILNNGGCMAPTTDKLRRGFKWGGMSPIDDLESGGASYFFTRIKSNEHKMPGFYWNSSLVSRLDTISYAGDKYGNVTTDIITSCRIGNVTELFKIKDIKSNETIFKNSLSIFDSIKYIRVNANERNEVISVFKMHGIFSISGRNIEDIVINAG